MDIHQALPLLAGLSPQQFMQRYWQKKPLLIRQALPGFAALLDRSELFALAGSEGVESRLVVHEAGGKSGASADAWRMSRGPFKRRALPLLTRAHWTLLVQGVDTHHTGVHQLLQQFRFVPDARLDDVMVSYASDGGGVGPHFDSYDVFLLQAHGQRRWRIGRQKDLRLQENVPLKILAHFEPEQEFVLDPGDMLYLPPRYAHDGVAVGECMTYSIGFRAPERRGLAIELLQLMVDELHQDLEDESDDSSDVLPGHPSDGAPRQIRAQLASAKTLYRDPQQAAVDAPGAIPEALQAFAAQAVQRVLEDAESLPRLLGESLTEPKLSTWFEPGSAPEALRYVALDRRTRMMYDQHHIFINGESYRAAGRDAVLMRALADQRSLGAKELKKAGADARALLCDWCEAGWAHSGNTGEE